MSTKTVETKKPQASKKKKATTLRNVLAETFPRYWPQIDKDQSEQLLEILKRVQNKHPEHFIGKKSNSSKRPIMYGLRASIRNLKTDSTQLLVINADLKPRYVVNQIILLALLNNPSIRVLCVPNLDTLLLGIVNFPCYAFVVVSDESQAFKELNDWSLKLKHSHYPLPPAIETHFAKNRKHSDVCEMEVEAECAAKNDVITTTAMDQVPNVSNQLYLLKEKGSSNQRAFVPKNAINFKPLTLEIDSLDQIKSDFISLDTYTDTTDNAFATGSRSLSVKRSKKKPVKNPPPPTPVNTYRPLTVYKVQGNNNKTKPGELSKKELKRLKKMEKKKKKSKK